MLKPDLKAAKIPYELDGEFFDFHCLRGEYGTELDRAGASPRTVQRLMRHSDLKLTDRYTRPQLLDLNRAALALPSLKPETGKPNAPALANTGTEGATGQAPTPFKAEDCTAEQPTNKAFAHHLPTGGRGLTRGDSDACAIASSDEQPSMLVSPHETRGFASSCGSVRKENEVEVRGLEPLAFWLQTRCSAS